MEVRPWDNENLYFETPSYEVGEGIVATASTVKTSSQTGPSQGPRCDQDECGKAVYGQISGGFTLRPSGTTFGCREEGLASRLLPNLLHQRQTALVPGAMDRMGANFQSLPC